MQKFLIKLLIDNSGRIFKSIGNAYRHIVNSNAGKTSGFENPQNTNKSKDPFAGWNFSDIAGTNKMTKTEALKILNFGEKEKLDAKKIIERFEKYFESNDPKNGGSFYLQNKFFYAKEILIKEFSSEDTTSKFDYLTNQDYMNYNKDNKV